MSRLDEAKKKIEYMLDAPSHQIEECFEESMALARTLAAEVDARDAVITELLAMLKPGKFPSLIFVDFPDLDAPIVWKTKAELHARACEIAGRAE
jgi:hypothetical protein